MTKREYLFWPVVIVFFLVWTVWIVFLPTLSSTGVIFFILELVRFSIILSFFTAATIFVFKASLTSVYALTKSTKLGMLLAGIYALSLVYYEASLRILNLSPNPWYILSLPFNAIAEELVFRGFIYTYLQHSIGRVQAVLISSVLSTLFYVPSAIFILELQSEAFIALMTQVFIFSLFQGCIRYVSKSVYPSILTHLIKNLLTLL
jgi:membrane protease YdiL (CAAX protease family)